MFRAIAGTTGWHNICNYSTRTIRTQRDIMVTLKPFRFRCSTVSAAVFPVQLTVTPILRSEPEWILMFFFFAFLFCLTFAIKTQFIVPRSPTIPSPVARGQRLLWILFAPLLSVFIHPIHSIRVIGDIRFIVFMPIILFTLLAGLTNAILAFVFLIMEVIKAPYFNLATPFTWDKITFFWIWCSSALLKCTLSARLSNSSQFRPAKNILIPDFTLFALSTGD